MTLKTKNTQSYKMATSFTKSVSSYSPITKLSSHSLTLLLYLIFFVSQTLKEKEIKETELNSIFNFNYVKQITNHNRYVSISQCNINCEHLFLFLISICFFFCVFLIIFQTTNKLLQQPKTYNKPTELLGHSRYRSSTLNYGPLHSSSTYPHHNSFAAMGSPYYHRDMEDPISPAGVGHHRSRSASRPPVSHSMDYPSN